MKTVEMGPGMLLKFSVIYSFIYYFLTIIINILLFYVHIVPEKLYWGDDNKGWIDVCIYIYIDTMKKYFLH